MYCTCHHGFLLSALAMTLKRSDSLPSELEGACAQARHGEEAPQEKRQKRSAMISTPSRDPPALPFHLHLPALPRLASLLSQRACSHAQTRPELSPKAHDEETNDDAYGTHLAASRAAPGGGTPPSGRSTVTGGRRRSRWRHGRRSHRRPPPDAAAAACSRRATLAVMAASARWRPAVAVSPARGALNATASAASACMPAQRAMGLTSPPASAVMLTKRTPPPQLQQHPQAVQTEPPPQGSGEGY